MARNRRAGARGAVLRPSPLRGGWLRPGPPRWPACRCSAPFRGLRCGFSGGPHAQPRPLRGRGPLSPARGPGRLWGRALAWRFRGPGVPPRRAPLRVAGRWRGGSPPRRPSLPVPVALAVGGPPPGGGFALLARRLGVPPLRRRDRPPPPAADTTSGGGGQGSSRAAAPPLTRPRLRRLLCSQRVQGPPPGALHPRFHAVQPGFRQFWAACKSIVLG